MRRWVRIVRSVSVVLVLLVVVLAVVWSLQRRMIYFPTWSVPAGVQGVREVDLDDPGDRNIAEGRRPCPDVQRPAVADDAVVSCHPTLRVDRHRR